MRSLAANTFLILIAGAVVFLTLLGIARKEYASPGPTAQDVVLSVPEGAGPRRIARLLADTGVLPETAVLGLVSGEALFRMGARYQRLDRAMKFGEYRIPAGASMEAVLARLVQGSNVRYNVTVAEGLTSWQVAERLREAEILTGEIEGLPPEGSLLPDTYAVNRDEPRSAVLGRMQAAMTEALDEAWAARAEDSPLKSKEELLILASIVEKETRPQEHGKVASVFVNRLRRGMRLQTDPTVIYGITEGKGPLGRGLRRSELNRRTPYNTYIIDGLPPTPIANPGRLSLMATARPDETPYIYFVADGTGGHAFAETLAEHNRNVAEWRRIERQRKADQ